MAKMNKMVERVARAQWEARRRHARIMAPELPDLEEWGDGKLPRSNGIIEEALAAILAMRVPTREMVNSAWIDGEDNKTGALVIESSTYHAPPGEELNADTAYEVWQAMIDEALK